MWISYSSCSLAPLSNKESAKVDSQHHFGLNYIIFSRVTCVRWGWVIFLPDFCMSSYPWHFLLIKVWLSYHDSSSSIACLVRWIMSHGGSTWGNTVGGNVALCSVVIKTLLWISGMNINLTYCSNSSSLRSGGYKGGVGIILCIRFHCMFKIPAGICSGQDINYSREIFTNTSGHSYTFLSVLGYCRSRHITHHTNVYTNM